MRMKLQICVAAQQWKRKGWQSSAFLSPVLLAWFASSGAHRIICSSSINCVSIFFVQVLWWMLQEMSFTASTGPVCKQCIWESLGILNCIVAKPSKFNQFLGSPYNPMAPCNRNWVSQYKTGLWNIHMALNEPSPSYEIPPFHQACRYSRFFVAHCYNCHWWNK